MAVRSWRFRHGQVSAPRTVPVIGALAGAGSTRGEPALTRIRVGSAPLIPATTSHPIPADHQPMRATREKTTSSWREGILLDDLLDAYVDWRESARAVTDAYDRWSFTSRRERASRFAAYAATLDQEQKTAKAYADAVKELERCLRHSNS